MADDYKPDWLCPEERVEKIDSSNDLELFSRDDDVGLFGSHCPKEPVEGEAAFLFGNTPDELWFRRSYAELVKIKSRDDDEKEIMERLFRADYGFYWSETDGEDGKKFPVYRDALDLLPLFHEVDPTSGRKALTQTQIDELDDEIEVAIDVEVESRDGCILSRSRFVTERLYGVDTARIGSVYFLFVYAHLGSPIAMGDEEWECWYSNVGLVANPVDQARRMLDFLGKEAQGVEFKTFVVLPGSTEFVGGEGEELEEIWRKESKITLCRSKIKGETNFRTLKQHLAEIDFSEESAKQIDSDTIRELLDRFSADPSNWNSEE